MRCAFFAATEHGLIIGRKLRNGLACSVDIFAKKSRAVEVNDVIGFDNMASAVAKAFYTYDALIFCTAAGIAVRMLAPCLTSKLTDPGVVVLDEQAKHVISLLSGHIGGGNSLTMQVAEVLGAVPVITTATDVNAMLAPDALAGKIGLRPFPKAQIQVVNSLMLQGEKPQYWLDKTMRRPEYWQDALYKQGIKANICEAAELAKMTNELNVLVTDKKEYTIDGLLYLTPRRLIAGIGCRRNTSKELIKNALVHACQNIGQGLEAISMLASTVVKSDEPGLLEMARELGIEIRFFDNDALQEKINQYSLTESAFVKKQIGVGNISAAAALCCVTEGRFALDKTKFEKVTVALVWEK